MRTGACRKTGQVCAKCAEVILTPGIEAMGRQWHGACFACFTCGVNWENGANPLFEHNLEPFCRGCWDNVGCVGSCVIVSCLKAWKRRLAGGYFPTWDLPCSETQPNNPTKFFFPLFRLNLSFPIAFETHVSQIAAQKCGKCSQPITDTYVEVLGMTLHETCFVCETCNIPFGNGGSYYKGCGPGIGVRNLYYMFHRRWC